MFCSHGHVDIVIMVTPVTKIEDTCIHSPHTYKKVTTPIIFTSLVHKLTWKIRTSHNILYGGKVWQQNYLVSSELWQMNRSAKKLLINCTRSRSSPKDFGLDRLLIVPYKQEY